MLYTKATKEAMRIAFEAYDGQADCAGIPYVNHPLHLAEQMDDEASTCAALLHDVVEDTGWELEDLRERGMPDDVLAAVDLLTHREGVPYMQYVERIADNEVARKVKIADLEHNSDLSRIDKVTEKDEARASKYLVALMLLAKED